MTDEGIKFVRIPATILYRADLRLTEKVFLGMVFSFGKGGLRLGNRQLGQILGMNAVNISKLISGLAGRGIIRIDAKKSRWRKIYFIASDKVKDDFTLSQNDSTLSPATSYFIASDKQKLKVKRNESESKSTDVELQNSDTLPETEPPAGSTAHKAPPDPEKVARVLADLGLDNLTDDPGRR